MMWGSSMSAHRRNVTPMLLSPRCGAKTREGSDCRSPAVIGKRRCRMHGGSTGSGAPTGNQNSVKHGLYTKEKREERREMIHLWREAQNYINDSRAKKRN